MLHVKGDVLSWIKVDVSFILLVMIDWLLRQRLHKSGGYDNLQGGYQTSQQDFNIGIAHKIELLLLELLYRAQICEVTKNIQGVKLNWDIPIITPPFLIKQSLRR